MGKYVNLLISLPREPCGSLTCALKKIALIYHLLNAFECMHVCLLKLATVQMYWKPVCNFCPITLQNLGHMTGSPHIVSDGHVTLEYTGGGVCSLTANYSTTVTLICSNSGLLVHMCILSCDICPIIIYWNVM